jgi:hypothetical protein
MLIPRALDKQMTRLVNAQLNAQRKYPVQNQLAKLDRAIHIEQDALLTLYQ